MTPKQLLQNLIDGVERESMFSDREVQTTPLQSDEKSAKTTVCIQVEGKTRIVEIQARDLGVFEGISA